MRVCEAWGLAHAPLLPLSVLPSLSLAPAGGPQPCSLCPSMSPESFVSGVVRVHVCARGTGVLSCLCAVWADEGWPVFTLSVFLLVFFLFPPHPHRTLPSTQTLISQISEKVGLFHFLSIYSSPTDCARQLGPAGLVSSLRLAPAVPARQLASAHHCLGWLVGRTRDGWAGLLPCMLLLLEPLMYCVSACPLSQALLLEWPHTHGARHKTAPRVCTWDRIAVCSR